MQLRGAADRLRSTRGVQRGELVLVGLLAGLLCAISLTAPVDTRGEPWVSTAGVPQDRAASVMLRGDGQFFAMLARDPTLARPEVMRTEPSDFAYRAIRPGYGWLAWAGSLGQPQGVPWAILALTVASTVALAAWSGAGVKVLVLPGVLVVVSFGGPEILGAALACLALHWCLAGRQREAMFALCAAVLLRETLVLIALGLVLARLMSAWRALVPAAALLAWMLIVSWRVAVPAGSRIQALGIMDASMTVASVASFAGLAAVAWLACRRDVRTAVALLIPHLALAVTTAPEVWRFQDWTRVFLPLFAVLLTLAVTEGPMQPGRDVATSS